MAFAWAGQYNFYQILQLEHGLHFALLSGQISSSCSIVQFVLENWYSTVFCGFSDIPDLSCLFILNGNTLAICNICCTVLHQKNLLIVCCFFLNYTWLWVLKNRSSTEECEQTKKNNKQIFWCCQICLTSDQIVFC